MGKVREAVDQGKIAISGLGGPKYAPGTVAMLAKAGIVRPLRPDRLVKVGLAFARWGVSPAGGVAVGAAKHPQRIAVISSDTGDTLTWGELDAQARAAAGGLATLGIGEGDPVGILARNSTAYMVVVTALAHLGADAVHVNTGFAGPQLGDVLDSQDVRVLLHDEEFTDTVASCAGSRTTVVLDADAPTGDAAESRPQSLAQLLSSGAPEPAEPPSKLGRQIILTSGTTGTPKGAARAEASGMDAAAFLSSVPLKSGGTTAIAAPLFHAWGFAHLSLALALGSTMVLARRFDPEAVLASIENHRVDALAAVPVMLQRIMELPEETRKKHQTATLRVVAVSGSALPGDLATKFMDEFGDVLYNLYGSTEVAYAAVASPKDLRADPATSGHPPRGTVLKLLGDDDQEVPQGEVGRVFVGSGMTFEGYTDGRDKDRVGNLVATGDLGRFDKSGRLRIEGRDDEMIVSGGENVYPGEVEDVLSSHSDVAEAAVVGVEDEKFGEALVAHVVLNQGASVSADDLKQRVKDNLARHKVPREVHFLDELPRGETGKVLKRNLKEGSDGDSGGSDGDGSGGGKESSAKKAPAKKSTAKKAPAKSSSGTDSTG